MRFSLLIVLLLLLVPVLSACGGETLDPWDSKGNLRELTDLKPGAREDLIKVSSGTFQVRVETTRDDCQTGKLSASSPSAQTFAVGDNGLGVRNDNGQPFDLVHFGDGLFCRRGPLPGLVECISGFIAGGYSYTVFGPDKEPCYQAHHSLVLAQPPSADQETAAEAPPPVEPSAPEPPAVTVPETEAQEDGDAPSESEAQVESGEVTEPEGESAADSGEQLPIADCIASPDMYTWSHTMTSKDEGKEGWKCAGKLIVSNVSDQPLIIEPHKDVSAGTDSPNPWVMGKVTKGEQYHEWHYQQILAPGETYEFDSNFTAYNNDTYTYRQITRILFRRDLAGCRWFTPFEAEGAANSPEESSLDIPNPCFDAPTTGGGG